MKTNCEIEISTKLNVSHFDIGLVARQLAFEHLSVLCSYGLGFKHCYFRRPFAVVVTITEAL